MACVYKEYRHKIKMVQEQWLQLKMKILLGYNMKLFIRVGKMNLWQRESTEWDFLVGKGWVSFWPVGEGLSYSPSRENPVSPLSQSVKNFKYPIWLSPPPRPDKIVPHIFLGEGGGGFHEYTTENMYIYIYICLKDKAINLWHSFDLKYYKI